MFSKARILRTFVTFKCKTCGQDFHRRLGDTKKATFCSRRCHALCHIAGKNKKGSDFVFMKKCECCCHTCGEGIHCNECCLGPNQRPNEWISVKDRLPEMGQEVLMFNGYGMHVAYHDKAEKEWRWNILRFYAVTHWMPLPEPPK